MEEEKNSRQPLIIHSTRKFNLQQNSQIYENSLHLLKTNIFHIFFIICFFHRFSPSICFFLLHLMLFFLFFFFFCVRIRKYSFFIFLIRYFSSFIDVRDLECVFLVFAFFSFLLSLSPFSFVFSFSFSVSLFLLLAFTFI